MNMKSIVGSGLTSQESRDKLAKALKKIGIKNKEVIYLISTMPRHLFIDTSLANRAYENLSLPIGHNQTISQPYMVAKMTELIHEMKFMNNVLEIGTGSGYQSAILSMLFDKVTTLERIESLHSQAKVKLNNLGFKNIQCIMGDGYEGYNLNAPYDAIIVTAAAEFIPNNLIEQLSENGRMVLPLKEGGKQKLLKIKKTKNGIIEKIIEDVLFVPMLTGIES